MIKRKRKAFTIVELVIVIAVIAILAAVLIPTFASIINKANESADIQAVRQMNMALMAESAVETPTDIKEVIRILKNAGYNATDKLVPVSAGHGFYWCKAANMITLIRDEGDNAPEIIFPVDNESIDDAFEAAKADDKKAINFGENKATESTDRTFYDLEPTSETYLPIIKEEEETAGGGEEITPATDLKAALEAGGTVKLGAPIELADPVTIAAGVESTLDLNGYTLNVNGSWEVSGEFTATNGTIIFDKPYDEESLYMTDGIEVTTTGVLELSGVEIIGKRLWNIDNVGETYLVDVIFTVNGGYGFSNKGGGEAVIDNCTFISNGEAASPVYCNGGTVDVYDSEFVEGTDFVKYYYSAPIEAHSGGVVTLEGVTVTTSADEHSVHAGANGNVVINSGSFNTKIFCGGDTSAVTIYGGTINDVAFEGITAESDIFDGANFELSYDDVKKCWVICK